MLYVEMSEVTKNNALRSLTLTGCELYRPSHNRAH